MSARVTYDVRLIPIDRIRAFAFQPRKYFDPKELKARAESMKALGQQDPVTVEPVTGDKEHDYELINGESRLRSARQAGIAELWAAVRSAPFPSRVQKHLASLVANFNRSDHTPMEICDALHVQLTEGRLRKADISRAIGKPHEWVRRYLSLRDLHPDIQALLHPEVPKARRISPSTAFELALLPVARQLSILEQCRGPDGKVTLQRVQLREMKKDAPAEAPTVRFDSVWTRERHAKWLARNAPNPEHVARLRAGIQEMRALLGGAERAPPVRLVRG